MLNESTAIGTHKVFQVTISEEPSFQFMIAQYFTDSIQEIIDNVPNQNNCRVIVGLNKEEFEFMWEKILKYRLELNDLNSENQ